MSENDEEKPPYYTEGEKRDAEQTAKDNLARTEAAESEHRRQVHSEQHGQQN